MDVISQMQPHQGMIVAFQEEMKTKELMLRKTGVGKAYMKALEDRIQQEKQKIPRKIFGVLGTRENDEIKKLESELRMWKYCLFPYECTPNCKCCTE